MLCVFSDRLSGTLVALTTGEVSIMWNLETGLRIGICRSYDCGGRRCAAHDHGGPEWREPRLRADRAGRKHPYSGIWIRHIQRAGVESASADLDRGSLRQNRWSFPSAAFGEPDADQRDCSRVADQYVGPIVGPVGHGLFGSIPASGRGHCSRHFYGRRVGAGAGDGVQRPGLQR